jgi:hypothetical protein
MGFALALAGSHVAAQSNSVFGSNPFDRDDVPASVQNFTGGTVRSVERDFRADLYILGAFNGRRSVDRYSPADIERVQPWRLYGRLGPMHFQNSLEGPTQGLQFSFRQTGPNLGSRAYVGIYRTFD